MRRVARISPKVWALTGIWIWAPAVIFAWVWTGAQVRLGWPLATAEALATWTSAVAARWAAAALYNKFLSLRHPLAWEESEGLVASAPLRHNFVPLILMSVPFALILSANANIWGWTVVLPHRWLLFPLVLLLGSWGYGLGTVLLYNQVVRWWGTSAIKVERQGEDGAILAPLGPWPVFRAVSIVTFIWFVCAIAAMWIVGGSLMVILAHRFPAGWFGLAVEVFGASLAAFVAYWVALLVGLWYALGVRLYAWRERRRGPLVWGQTADEVTS